MALIQHESPEPWRKRMVGSEGIDVETDQGKQVVRSGATGVEADFDLRNFDLSEGAFNIPDDVGLSEPPNVGGTSTMVLWLVSESDEQFEMELQPVDEDGKTLGTPIDKNVDSRLQSSSPTGKNHHIYEALAMPADVFELDVLNTGTPGTNILNGTINIH